MCRRLIDSSRDWCSELRLSDVALFRCTVVYHIMYRSLSILYRSVNVTVLNFSLYFQLVIVSFLDYVPFIHTFPILRGRRKKKKNSSRGPAPGRASRSRMIADLLLFHARMRKPENTRQRYLIRQTSAKLLEEKGEIKYRDCGTTAQIAQSTVHVSGTTEDDRVFAQSYCI